MLAVVAVSTTDASFDGFTPTFREPQRQIEGAAIRFEPEEITVDVDDVFDVAIIVDAGSQQVSGAQLFMDFDPNKIQVQDSDSSRNGLQIQNGTTLSTVLVNSADNSSGQIVYAASKLGTPFPNGEFTVAIITFQAIESTSMSGTELEFTLDEPRETIVEFGGESILDVLEGATVVIDDTSNVTSTPIPTATSGSGGNNNPTRTPTRTPPPTPTFSPTPAPTNTVVPVRTSTPVPAQQTRIPTLTPTATEPLSVTSVAELIDAIEDIRLTSDQAAEGLVSLGPLEAAIVLQSIPLGDAVEIFPNLNADFASATAAEIPATSLSAIISGLDRGLATSILEEISVEKLIEVVEVMEEDSLLELLPEISTDKFYGIPEQTLSASLPSVEFERVAFEIPPQVNSTWISLAESHETITRVLGKFNEPGNDVKARIETLSSKPPELPDLQPEFEVFQFLSINLENAPEEEASAFHIEMLVDKSWLESNGIHKWSVGLSRFDDTQNHWVHLPAKRVDEDDETVRYTVVASGLSFFAIVGSQELPELNFDVTDLSISPSLALEGEEVEISFRVRNRGQVMQIFPAYLWISGTIEDSKSIPISPGGTASVSFKVTKPEGTYDVRVGRLIGEFSVSPSGSVTQENTPTVTATLIPTATSVPTPEATPTSTSLPTDTGTTPVITPSSTSTPNDASPGSTEQVPPNRTSRLLVIVIAIVGALLGITLIAIILQYFGRRR